MLIVLAFLLSENAHLEDSNGISLRQGRHYTTFFNPFFFFKYCHSTHILWRIALPISSYL